ncbi:MAG: hypothetical protein AMXMBFR83_04300 [Phycisphaerae bacterium]
MFQDVYKDSPGSRFRRFLCWFEVIQYTAQEQVTHLKTLVLFPIRANFLQVAEHGALCVCVEARAQAFQKQIPAATRHVVRQENGILEIGPMGIQ